MYRKLVLSLCLVLLSAVTVVAQDEEPGDAKELSGMSIVGNDEAPKSLYIVPWKRSRPELSPLPMRSLVEERLSPLDMDEFRRRVHYYELTQPNPNP